jgi:hypothetical protein
VATSKNGRVAVCPDCAAEGGPAAEMIREALDQPDPTARKFEELRGGKAGAKPGGYVRAAEFSGAGQLTAAELSLVSQAERARGRAKREGRRMTRQETRLSLDATAAVQRRATLARLGRSGNGPALAAAKAMVKRLDLDRGRR